MTASVGFFASDLPGREPIRMIAGGRMVVRAFQRLIGFAFMLAAALLWLAPGASWEADIMLFKLVLSVVGLLAGAGLALASRSPDAPEIEIDPVRSEVRLVRDAGIANTIVLQRCAFDALSHVETDGPHVRLWDDTGEFLAEVSLEGNAAMGPLMDSLRHAGKVA